MRPLFHPAIEDVRPEAILHALADPSRAAIFATIMRAGCVEACSALAAVGDRVIPKSSLSNHFKVLREAGLIRSERHGVELRKTHPAGPRWRPLSRPAAGDHQRLCVGCRRVPARRGACRRAIGRPPACASGPASSWNDARGRAPHVRLRLRRDTPEAPARAPARPRRRAAAQGRRRRGPGRREGAAQVRRRGARPGRSAGRADRRGRASRSAAAAASWSDWPSRSFRTISAATSAPASSPRMFAREDGAEARRALDGEPPHRLAQSRIRANELPVLLGGGLAPGEGDAGRGQGGELPVLGLVAALARQREASPIRGRVPGS